MKIFSVLLVLFMLQAVTARPANRNKPKKTKGNYPYMWMTTCRKPRHLPCPNHIPVKSQYRLYKRIYYICPGNNVYFKYCGFGGKWSPSHSVFQSQSNKQSVCSKPTITDKFLKIASKKTFWYAGESIRFKCKDKFRVVGEATSSCGANGKWKNELPRCFPPLILIRE